MNVKGQPHVLSLGIGSWVPHLFGHNVVHLVVKLKRTVDLLTFIKYHKMGKFQKFSSTKWGSSQQNTPQGEKGRQNRTEKLQMGAHENTSLLIKESKNHPSQGLRIWPFYEVQ
uniref:Uncharacterized protein n=1 Tax=Anguilla anguilla TaxID=7936 RepID=A0A0E9SHH4_ANGAN